jgi:Mor family transcriptional regulator
MARPCRNAARDREIVDAYAAGARIGDLEKQYGISTSRLCQIFARAGVVMRGPALTSRNVERDQEIIARYTIGASVADLALEYQLHESRIDQILRRAGVERRTVVRGDGVRSQRPVDQSDAWKSAIVRGSKDLLVATLRSAIKHDILPPGMTREAFDARCAEHGIKQ